MLVLMVLAVVLLALRSCVVAFTPEQPPDTSDSSGQEIVRLGNETLVLSSGSVGGKIVSWLTAGRGGTRAFTVGERSFPPGSDEPNQMALIRFDRFANMMRAEPDVKARVIVLAANDGQFEEQLAKKRAARIRAELIARDVPMSRVSTEGWSVAASPKTFGRERPEIVVVLSK